MFTGTLLHLQSLQVIVAWCEPELAMLLEVLSMTIVIILQQIHVPIIVLIVIQLGSNCVHM